MHETIALKLPGQLRACKDEGSWQRRQVLIQSADCGTAPARSWSSSSVCCRCCSRDSDAGPTSSSQVLRHFGVGRSTDLGASRFRAPAPMHCVRRGVHEPAARPPPAGVEALRVVFDASCLASRPRGRCSGRTCEHSEPRERERSCREGERMLLDAGAKKRERSCREGQRMLLDAGAKKQ